MVVAAGNGELADAVASECVFEGDASALLVGARITCTADACGEHPFGWSGDDTRCRGDDECGGALADVACTADA